MEDLKVAEQKPDRLKREGLRCKAAESHMFQPQVCFAEQQ